MTRRAFDKIKAGLDDALAFASGDNTRAVVHHIPTSIDVRSIRKTLGLSQRDFALRYGFTLARIRDWEQGRSSPDNASRAFLIVIEREHKAVDRALKVA